MRVLQWRETEGKSGEETAKQDIIRLDITLQGSGGPGGEDMSPASSFPSEQIFPMSSQGPQRARESGGASGSGNLWEWLPRAMSMPQHFCRIDNYSFLEHASSLLPTS